MFLTGFSASGMEMLLLFGLQIFFGNIYLLTSFVFTGFMIGLAIGSFFGKSFSEKDYLALNQFLIGFFAVLIGVTLFSSKMAEWNPVIVYSLFLSATILFGGLTGFQFFQTSQKSEGNYSEISGKTYSYDLFGSAFGAFALSILLVPRFGIFESVLIIGLANILFGTWLILKKHIS